MKRVMIVDDEALVRMGIRALLPWEEHGYEVVGDASNGEEALEQIANLHPDIVLTDLKMEPGDGFFLIRSCRKTYPSIVFIVLSNYNDMDNVKQAMKLGASDYIFKLTIKQDELLKILDEASSQISTLTKPEERVVKQNMGAIKTGILMKLIEGDEGVYSPEELLRDLSLQVSLDQTYRAMCLRIDNYRILSKRGDFPKPDLLRFTVENIVVELLEKRYAVDVFSYNESCFVILLNGIEAQLDLLKEEFQFLRTNIKRILGTEVSASISRDYCGSTQVRAAIRESMEIMQRAYHSMDELKMLEPDRTLEEHKEFRKNVLNQFRDILEQGRLLEGLQKFEEILCETEKEEPLNREEIRHFFRKLYRMLYVEFQKTGLDLDQNCDQNGANFNEALEGYDNYQDLKKALEELFDSYRRTYLGDDEKRTRKEILQVKQYVKENLSEELSISAAAAMVNMSPSRFAHIFKEETGTSFGEYVNKKRMKQAAWLLNQTDFRIAEIAERVGIDNPNYFSVQFKRMFGCSPLEYRRDSMK